MSCLNFVVALWSSCIVAYWLEWWTEKCHVQGTVSCCVLGKNNAFLYTKFKTSSILFPCSYFLFPDSKCNQDAPGKHSNHSAICTYISNFTCRVNRDPKILQYILTKTKLYMKLELLPNISPSNQHFLQNRKNPRLPPVFLFQT